MNPIPTISQIILGALLIGAGIYLLVGLFLDKPEPTPTHVTENQFNLGDPPSSVTSAPSPSPEPKIYTAYELQQAAAIGVLIGQYSILQITSSSKKKKIEVIEKGRADEIELWNRFQIIPHIAWEEIDGHGGRVIIDPNTRVYGIYVHGNGGN